MAYMYSKKVMELFRHPHNMGEIKDADAVGKVGNPMCLLSDTMIHTNDKFIGIKDVCSSTKVLGHDGFFNKVQRIISRNYSGSMVLIKNKLGITVLTPEHEVLAVKIPKRWIYSYARGKKTLTTDWYHAEELRKGDLAVYPIVKEVTDRKFIRTLQERKKWDFKSVKIPKKIIIDSDFLRFCGYYLAEGSFEQETGTKFTFNINEADLAEDVERIARKIFDIEAKKRIIKERKTLIVTINNVFIVHLIKSLFGKGAADKRIPHWMMLLPTDKQKGLIYGLWHGDGYFNEKRPRAGYSTISYQLAQQIKTLLLRQGIAPSIYVEEERVAKDGVKHKKAYRLHIEEKIYLERLAKILKIKFIPKRPEAISSWFKGNYLFAPITKVDKMNYSGKVHNLEIKKSKSYVTESLAVHNCGDLMWMYVKFGKNKEGREIIKDIKVKTFGCVAALATSSLTTDLAKGKTIEEALKITNRDVIKGAGGLPSIKTHCSVLAVDALREAIYKYLKKKGLAIPKEVLESHKRVQKELKEVEHMREKVLK